VINGSRNKYRKIKAYNMNAHVSLLSNFHFSEEQIIILIVTTEN